MRWLGILRDHFVLALIAGAMAATGALALGSPVKLDDYDRWGFRIACGTAIASSYGQATIADERPAGASPQRAGSYVDACQSAVVWRRAWAGSLAGLGGVGLAGVLRGHDRRRAALAERGDQ